MKVKMLTDAPGSPDGVTVNDYDKDEVYEVSDALGNAFLNHGLAEATETDEPKPVGESVTKKDTGPSENKSDG